MIRQLFKLIWKKRKSHVFMIMEITISFIILFAVWSLGIYNYRNYQIASNIDVEGVLRAKFDYGLDTLPNIDFIQQQLNSNPKVSNFSFTSANTPFSNSISNRTISTGNQQLIADVIRGEPNLPEILGLEILQGRWLEWADTVGTKPAVITQKLASKLFGTDEPIGARFTMGEGEWQTEVRVVGVVQQYKHVNDFQQMDYAVFEPTFMDWDKYQILIKMKATTSATEIAQIAQNLSTVGVGWKVEVDRLSDLRMAKNRTVWIPILILLVVCGFLLFNVALGVFGVLFQNINRRKNEIGIRRAIGARKSSVFGQFIGEAAVLVTLSVAIGLFFILPFPLQNIFGINPEIYLTSTALAVISIYLLVSFCAFYPSAVAAALPPAMALHEE